MAVRLHHSLSLPPRQVSMQGAAASAATTTNLPPTPKAKREQKPKYGPVSVTAHTRQSCALQVRSAPFGAVAVVHSPTASRSFKNESVPPGACAAFSSSLSACTAHTPPPPKHLHSVSPHPNHSALCMQVQDSALHELRGDRGRMGMQVWQRKKCSFAHGRDELQSKRTAAEQPTLEHFYAIRSRPFRTERQKRQLQRL